MDDLAERYLETYTLEELLEISDLTEIEVVEFLIRHGLMREDIEHGL